MALLIRHNERVICSIKIVNYNDDNNEAPTTANAIDDNNNTKKRRSNSVIIKTLKLLEDMLIFMKSRVNLTDDDGCHHIFNCNGSRSIERRKQALEELMNKLNKAEALAAKKCDSL